MSDQLTRTKEQVEAATVDLPEMDGRGVLVPGGYILTAAHCIRKGMSYEELADGNPHMHRIRTASGLELVVDLIAVEPRADIAVLAAGERQEEVRTFDDWAGQTLPVPLSSGVPQGWDMHVAVLVLNRNRTWVSARVDGAPGAQTLSFPVPVEVESGASGGPVVTAAGALLGLVSMCSDSASGGEESDCECGITNPSRALPVWLFDRIKQKQDALAADDTPG